MASWIDKELKRRAAREGRETAAGSTGLGQTDTQLDAARIAALWSTIDAANASLPAALRLHREEAVGESGIARPPFRTWLVAPNHAALGFNGEAIRYMWPEPGKRHSHNFWLRWRAASGYVLCRRVGSTSMVAHVRERRFDEARIDLLLKRLVTGVRVTDRAVCKRRLWLF